ncbi:MAG: DUF370 domain-containing protein [Clostridia bacterium]|nr:DUF370 domain-containing protein [Clostridia bacterium]
MYLHLGNNVVIRKSGVIGIYDIDKTTVAGRTREFLTHFEKSGRLTYVTNELPKSFIVYDDGHGLHVFISQISTTTLLKRSDFLNKSSESSEF